jgi:hypothetical protein
LVARTVRGAKTLSSISEAGFGQVKWLKELLTPALRAQAQALGSTVAVETAEAAALRAAAAEAAALRGAVGQTAKAGAKSGGWRVAARFGAKRLVLGALGFAGTLLTVYTVWQIGSAVWHWARPSKSTANQPCPPAVLDYRPCPWTPEDADLQPCLPGFCWDGGFQGSLACKQEKDVPNAHRGSLMEIICNDGYVPELDPCLGTILRCVRS